MGYNGAVFPRLVFSICAGVQHPFGLLSLRELLSFLSSPDEETSFRLNDSGEESWNPPRQTSVTENEEGKRDLPIVMICFTTCDFGWEAEGNGFLFS